MYDRKSSIVPITQFNSHSATKEIRMGFKYLDGKLWAQVTRDERFFCQRLYELVRLDGAEKFAGYISEEFDLDLSMEGVWEIGFEVCFYRDLWQYRKKDGELFSPKRTFDLCLFGENAIIIIEAKAAGQFDRVQNIDFERDLEEVKRLTGIEQVYLVGLCSSKCPISDDTMRTFQGRILRWKDMMVRYDGDTVLKRADNVFEASEAFATFGRNSDERLNGTDLVKAFEDGLDMWVGRSGGIHGSKLREDVNSGRWRTQVYEVNTVATEQPSSNYFRLSNFVEAVDPCGIV